MLPPGEPLEGTYDVARIDLHIRPDLRAEDFETCEWIADYDASEYVEAFETYRFILLEGGLYVWEQAFDAPHEAISWRSSHMVELADGVYLDHVNGASQCIYTNGPGGEFVNVKPYAGEEDLEGADYPPSFSADEGSLRVVH